MSRTTAARTATAASKVVPPAAAPKNAPKTRKPRTRKYSPEEAERRIGWLRTRAPRQLWEYVLWLSRNPALGYKTLQGLATWLMVKFSQDRPWEHGLKWREPKAHVDGTGQATGWVQVNLQVATTSITDADGHEHLIRGEDLAERVRQAAEQCGVSQATYCYTALWYLTTYIYRPQGA